MVVGIQFFERFQEQLESQQDKEMSSAIYSSISRLIILFDTENVKDNYEAVGEEELIENIDILKSLLDAKGFEEWIKDQLEYQDDSDLESTFYIGNNDSCEYKNIEEFIEDLDYEKASTIIKECFEKAMNSGV